MARAPSEASAGSLPGGVAEWSCSGLQSRVRRFDSDPRLQTQGPPRSAFGPPGTLSEKTASREACSSIDAGAAVLAAAAPEWCPHDVQSEADTKNTRNAGASFIPCGIVLKRSFMRVALQVCHAQLKSSVTPAPRIRN